MGIGKKINPQRQRHTSHYVVRNPKKTDQRPEIRKRPAVKSILSYETSAILQRYHLLKVHLHTGQYDQIRS